MYRLFNDTTSQVKATIFCCQSYIIISTQYLIVKLHRFEVKSHDSFWPSLKEASPW